MTITPDAAPVPEQADDNRCPDCGHQKHGEVCYNMASDNECSCKTNTTGVPFAPFGDAAPFEPPAPPPIPPAPAYMDSPPTPPEAIVPAKRNRKGGFIALAILVALVIAAVVIALVVKANEKLTVLGTFEFSGTNNADCTGYQGYEDIGPNTQVSISAGGTVLGFTSLGSPVTGQRGNDGTCRWVFEIDGVAKGKGVYTVEVGKRGGINFTQAQIEAGDVGVTLGGN